MIVKNKFISMLTKIQLLKKIQDPNEWLLTTNVNAMKSRWITVKKRNINAEKMQINDCWKQTSNVKDLNQGLLKTNIWAEKKLI